MTRLSTRKFMVFVLISAALYTIYFLKRQNKIVKYWNKNLLEAENFKSPAEFGLVSSPYLCGSCHGGSSINGSKANERHSSTILLFEGRIGSHLNALMHQ